jgi:hypothetical protein
MDGARAAEARARELVAKLVGPTASAWTVAELFILGDCAVAPLEELAGALSSAPAERRRLASMILEAIGTPAARAAAKRSLAGEAAEIRSYDGAA